MRTLCIAALLGWFATARAELPRGGDDAHLEMAAALAAQIDLQPAPLVLPVAAAAPRHAAAASAVQRGTGARGPSEVSRATASAAAANRISQQAQGASQALAHQAQAAAAAAAGQAQSKAAKERSSHPHPR